MYAGLSLYVLRVRASSLLQSSCFEKVSDAWYDMQNRFVDDMIRWAIKILFWYMIINSNNELLQPYVLSLALLVQAFSYVHLCIKRLSKAISFIFVTFAYYLYPLNSVIYEREYQYLEQNKVLASTLFLLLNFCGHMYLSTNR